jgi:glyoxylase-like metal-dependent hydrolase (beta-lactamase superfamily II)
MRRQLSSAVAFGHEMISALPALEFALPTLVFTDRLTLHAASRRVELLTFGGGHTESDLFAFLPDDGVLFAGDLIVLRHHPWLGDGDIVAWPQIVRRIEQLEFSILVPGHGPVGVQADAAFVPRYVADLLRLTNDRMRDGATADAVAATPVLDQYADLDAPEVYAHNMRFLHAFVAARQAQE